MYKDKPEVVFPKDNCGFREIAEFTIDWNQNWPGAILFLYSAG